MHRSCSALDERAFFFARNTGIVPCPAPTSTPHILGHAAVYRTESICARRELRKPINVESRKLNLAAAQEIPEGSAFSHIDARSCRAKPRSIAAKEWIEHRLRELADIVAARVGEFSALDNHLHLVMPLDPDLAGDGSDAEVDAPEPLRGTRPMTAPAAARLSGQKVRYWRVKERWSARCQTRTGYRR
jgi:hypothetical protein